jgi:putative FmdB family regulatory protein
MPIYAYRCSACGHAQDVLQKISDPLLTVCPACGESTYVKQVTAAGFQLKGSGWYVTDFRGGQAASKGDAAAEPGAKAETGAEAKGDAKPDAANGAKPDAKAATQADAKRTAPADAKPAAKSDTQSDAKPSPGPAAPAAGR